MKHFIRWFKNISIAKKLYLTIGVMALLIVLELLTLKISISSLSAVRTSVETEGAWSKAQKDAIDSLRKYAPNQLIFGDRFAFNTIVPEVIKEMLPYVDAIAIQPPFQGGVPRQSMTRFTLSPASRFYFVISRSDSKMAKKTFAVGNRLRTRLRQASNTRITFGPRSIRNTSLVPFGAIPLIRQKDSAIPE